MRRVVDHWWLVGSALLVAVVVLTGVLYGGEADRHQQLQRATQRQVVTDLSASVNDVLAREVALARVVGTLQGPVAATLACALEHRHEPAAGEQHGVHPACLGTGPNGIRAPDRAAAHRVVQARRAAHRRAPPAAAPRAHRRPTGRPRTAAARARRGGATRCAASFCCEAAADRASARHSARSSSSARSAPTRGVVVYVAVRDRHGRLKGWVTAAYKAQQLASMVTAQMPGVHLTIRDGASTLISQPGAPQRSRRGHRGRRPALARLGRGSRSGDLRRFRGSC